MKRFSKNAFFWTLLILVTLLSSRPNSSVGQELNAFPSGFDVFSSPGESVGGLPPGMSSFKATVVSVPSDAEISAETSNLWKSSRPDSSERPSAFLAIEVKLQPDWHIYSTTQARGSGAYPTKIPVEPPKDEAFGNVKIGEFFPASKIEFVDFMDNVLEEMTGTVVWLAPIFSEKPIDDWSRLRLNGKLDALVCSAGENGLCNPVKYEFVAKFDGKLDVLALLDRATEIAFDQQRPTPVSDQIVSSSENAPTPPPPDAKQTDAKQTDANQTDANQTKPAQSIGETPDDSTVGSGFSPSILLYAFLGGLILNVMPCVLPVIGLKIISFFEQAGHSRAKAFWLNGWYAIGMLSVFAVLAFLSVGLSYLFTYGLFQIIMGAIVFAMALSLMGLWELRLPGFLGGSKSNELMEKEGAVGAYFKGIITTLLAIPCGAPLLSPALVWADSMIQQGNTFLVLFVYLVIGLGMASPYLLIGAFPELLRFLPKPGLWMETFRVAMGYVLLTAVVWILFSMPIPLVVPTIALLFAIWFACWLIGRIPFGAKFSTSAKSWGIALTVVMIVIFFSFNIRIGKESSLSAPNAKTNDSAAAKAPIKSEAGGRLLNPYTLEGATESKLIRWAIRAERAGLLEQSEHWALFDQKLLEQELAAGNPVVIDFTADWCMNCKVLESTILHSEKILNLADQKGIRTLTADWTNQNDDSQEIQDINSLFDRFGGRQVPTVMIFDPASPEQPKVFRGLFPESQLVEALERLPDRE